jgi:hypothetical protein
MGLIQYLQENFNTEIRCGLHLISIDKVIREPYKSIEVGSEK